MPHKLTTIKDSALGALDNLVERFSDPFNPTIRLGVTGLSRAGKTVFITSVVQNLLHGGKLPMLKAYHAGRVTKTYLQHQPDDDIARFSLEDYVHALIEERQWPHSTQSISQLRLTLEFERPPGWLHHLKTNRLHLDIIDYPGEWLLDLPLLAQSYAEFCDNTIALAQHGPRSALSAQWRDLANQLDPYKQVSEEKIIALSDVFKQYLQACRDDEHAFSTLPPGRFLMPGDLKGSPLITFAPLFLKADQSAAPRGDKDSLLAIMERRFESYKTKVIWPFYHNHFARLDRQIILIDALQALNRGPDALIDMERALGDILKSFNVGKNVFPFNLLTRKIDKVLIAATKADHLHHESHDQLELLAQKLVARAVERHDIEGLQTSTVAIAAIRATQEAYHQSDGTTLPLIVGTPQQGEKLGHETFDGQMQKAIFPGDLPDDLPDELNAKGRTFDQTNYDQKHPFAGLNFVRFRPPAVAGPASKATFSHIRLDRALEFLIGDQLI